VDETLDRALRVFWRKGYEGASLADLTRAMRISRPSLYAAFGDKQALFLRVLDRYAAGPASYAAAALAAPTAHEAARQLLHRSAELLTDPKGPRGCLMVQAALACGEAAEPVRKELAARRLALEAAVRTRFERAQAEGDLSATADAAALAGFVVTVLRGMAVQAAGGTSREELQRVAEVALTAWPGGSKAPRRGGPHFR
jgi:AcrR family transcriptional regulator